MKTQTFYLIVLLFGILLVSRQLTRLLTTNLGVLSSVGTSIGYVVNSQGSSSLEPAELRASLQTQNNTDKEDMLTASITRKDSVGNEVVRLHNATKTPTEQTLTSNGPQVRGPVIRREHSRAVIYLLANEEGGERITQISTSLHLLVNNYLDLYHLHNNTKVVIFHDNTVNSSTLQGLTGVWSRGLIELANITNHADFQEPPWRLTDTKMDRYRRCAGKFWKAGYIYQMVFRTRGMFTHNALDNVESVIRLDTDLYFEKPQPFDLFARFERDNLVYAYHHCTREKALDCLDGLPETIGNYTKERGLTPKHLADIEWNTAYAGNFGIAKLSFFRGSDYQSLANYVVSAQGMHRARWTDQNINALALAMLVEHWQVANWYWPLKIGGYIEHRSQSLGRLFAIRGKNNVQNNGDGPMCKIRFGCSCRDSDTDPEERLRIKFAKFGLEPPVKNRKAFCTMVADDDFVKGALVLFSSLKRTKSLLPDADFVVLETGTISEGAMQALERVGSIVIRASSLEKIDRTAAASFSDRYKDKSWMMFAKLNVFNLTQYDRVVYLDSDMIALRDISELLDNKTVPALSATPERSGLEPEFNAGLLVADPSSALFDDMKKHVDDEEYLCGFRATDQSFLCHYFHPSHRETWLGGTWNSLPRSYMALRKAGHPKKALRESKILHFNAAKPWSNQSQVALDMFSKRWNAVAQTCGVLCEIPTVGEEPLPPETSKKRRRRMRKVTQ